MQHDDIKIYDEDDMKPVHPEYIGKFFARMWTSEGGADKVDIVKVDSIVLVGDSTIPIMDGPMISMSIGGGCASVSSSVLTMNLDDFFTYV